MIYDMKSPVVLFYYSFIELSFFILYFFNFLKPSLSMQKGVIFIHSLRMSGFHA